MEIKAEIKNIDSMSLEELEKYNISLSAKVDEIKSFQRKINKLLDKKLVEAEIKKLENEIEAKKKGLATNV